MKRDKTSFVISFVGIWVMVFALTGVVNNVRKILIHQQITSEMAKEMTSKILEQVISSEDSKIKDDLTASPGFDEGIEKGMREAKADLYKLIVYYLACIISGTAIFKRKNWGRFLFLGLICVALFIKIKIVISDVMCCWSVLPLYYIAQFLLFVAVGVILIVYFIHPKVKEKFKQIKN